jgi:hypothetical protein
MVILSFAWGRSARSKKDSAIPGPICDVLLALSQHFVLIEVIKHRSRLFQKVADTQGCFETLLAQIPDKIDKHADHHH